MYRLSEPPTHVKIVLLWIVQDLHQPHHVGVVQLLQDGDLTVHTLQGVGRGSGGSLALPCWRGATYRAHML